VESFLRIDEIDLIRGIGIIAVVAVHIAQHAITYSYGNITVNIILDAVSRFCVPFFVFVSGTVFAYNYHDKKKYYCKFLLKRLKYIGIPYLLWSVLGFVRYKIYAPQKIIIGLLSGSAMIHLYFIILIFLFYILSPILLYLIKIDWKKSLMISIVANIIILSIYSYGFPNLNLSHLNNLRPFINPLFWIAYFMAGIVVGLNMNGFNKLMLKLKFVVLIIAWLFLMIISIYEEYFTYTNKGFIQHFFRPSNMLYSFISIIFFWKLYGKMNIYVKRILVILGHYSFGIYLAHIPILFVIHKLTEQYWGNPFEMFVSFFICIIISFVFTFFLSKTKIGVFIVGKV